jgi:hypothetical protein
MRKLLWISLVSLAAISWWPDPVDACSRLRLWGRRGSHCPPALCPSPAPTQASTDPPPGTFVSPIPKTADLPKPPARPVVPKPPEGLFKPSTGVEKPGDK